MRQALTGWADDDYSAVAMLAPIAVEHLGKAALWSRHPALLVPLANNAEESLYILAGQPELANVKLRTVGLAIVLQRLERYLDPFPLSKDKVRSLVDVRNGSVHVGLKTPSKALLSDALSLCAALLTDLDVDSAIFYGDQEANVRGLLNEKRTEVEANVAAKVARSQNHLSTLREKLGVEVFEDAAARLEAEARAALNPVEFGSFGDSVAIDQTCPTCGNEGRLAGRLDADPQVDWDVEKIEGQYHPYPVGTWWELSFTPHTFGCNVCKLELDGPEEMAVAFLPSRRYTLEAGDLDDDFDVDHYTRSLEEDYS